MGFSSSEPTSHSQAQKRDIVDCLSRSVLYLVELKVRILLWGCTDKQSGTGAQICLLQAPWYGLKVRMLSSWCLDRWQAKPGVTQPATSQPPACFLCIYSLRQTGGQWALKSLRVTCSTMWRRRWRQTRTHTHTCVHTSKQQPQGQWPYLSERAVHLSPTVTLSNIYCCSCVIQISACVFDQAPSPLTPSPRTPLWEQRCIKDLHCVCWKRCCFTSHLL